jgi:hypothetical protein
VLWLDKIGNENKWNEWLNTTKCREKIVCYKRERERERERKDPKY